MIEIITTTLSRCKLQKKCHLLPITACFAMMHLTLLLVLFSTKRNMPIKVTWQELQALTLGVNSKEMLFNLHSLVSRNDLRSWNQPNLFIVLSQLSLQSRSNILVMIEVVLEKLMISEFCANLIFHMELTWMLNRIF